MKIKKCEICGKEFDAIKGRQITCSPECRKIHNREYARANYKKPVIKPKKKVDNGLAEENEIARSLGLDYGTYKAYIRIGYLDQYLRIKFHNETAINADNRVVEKSWIGGGYHSNKNKAENTMQKLTDYNSRR